MKGVVVKLTLGKRDNIIKAWINLILRQGGNFSRSVDYAITYFAKTGSYLHLGNIAMTEGETDSPPKNIYFAQNSPAVAWLAERKQDGEKEATAIKRVLRRCLTQDEDGINQITGIDDLYDIVQAARREKEVEVVSKPTDVIKEPTQRDEQKNATSAVKEQTPLTEEASKTAADDDFTRRFVQGFSLFKC